MLERLCLLINLLRDCLQVNVNILFQRKEENIDMYVLVRYDMDNLTCTQFAPNKYPAIGTLSKIFVYNYNFCFQKSDHNVKLSKALSYILRHGAAKEGLQMTEG